MNLILISNLLFLFFISFISIYSNTHELPSVPLCPLRTNNGGLFVDFDYRALVKMVVRRAGTEGIIITHDDNVSNIFQHRSGYSKTILILAISLLTCYFLHVFSL